MSEAGQTQIAPAASAPAASSTPAAALTHWFDSFDTETKGYIQNKGLDRLDPAQAFLKVSEFHRNAEKHLGVPSDQIVRLPKDAGDTAARQNIFTKLGKPADASGYKFDGVVFPSPEVEKEIRELSFKYDMTQEQAAGWAKESLAKSAHTAEADTAATTAQLLSQKNDLKKEWGFNFNANLEVARAGALKMGLSPDEVTALEKQQGYKALMSAFHKIGVAFGEDKFVTSAHTGRVMTREGAIARIAELKADRTWAAKYMAGGPAEKKEMADLMQIGYGKAS